MPSSRRPSCRPGGRRRPARAVAPTLPAFAVLLAAVGCSSPDAGEEARVTRRDSAGVDIVTSRAPDPSGTGVWRIDSVPQVSIGTTEGEAPYVFGRVSGAVRVGGRIAVADAQATEIRFFDLDGRYLHTVGRKGEGPGELQTLVGLWRCGDDRVHAFDFVARTVQVRTATGELRREVDVSVPRDEGSRSPYTVECAVGGPGFAVVARALPGDRQPRSGTVVEQYAPIYLLDDSGRTEVELPERLIAEHVFVRLPDGSSVSAPHPFGGSATVELGPDHLFVASARGREVEVLDRQGRPVRRLRAASGSGPADPAELLETYRTAELSPRDEQRRVWMEEADWPMPDGVPGYTGLRLDGSGTLWAERFSPPWSDGGRWDLFASDGSWVGTVDLPAGLRLTDVGATWIVGVREDALGVQRVQMFRVGRGDGGG